MNKKSFFKKCWFVVFIGLGLFSLSGCEQLLSDEAFNEIQTAPEKLRQIETFDLEHIKSEQMRLPDANEAPPKQH